MPYQWITPPTAGAEAELHLWPYRSLPRRGFVWFIGGTAAALTVPLLAVLGSPILWGLLPFMLLVLWALWWALSRSYRDGAILEVLRLAHDRVTLIRDDPLRGRLAWDCNAHWVALTLHRSGGPVPDYLTLRGGGREVELGAFLTPEERLHLLDELQRELDRLKQAAPPV